MFCPNCGKQIQENTNFCPHCGAKAEKPKPVYPAPTPPVPPQPQSLPIPKKSGAGKTLAIVIPICTVALAAVLVCTMLFLNHQNQPAVYPPVEDYEDYEDNSDNLYEESEAENDPVPTPTPVPEVTAEPEPTPAPVVPVSLTELDAIKQGEYFYVGTDSFFLYNITSKICQDVNKTTYASESIHYVAYYRMYEEEDDYRSITYYLNQDYTLLTGILYRPYLTLSCDIEWTSDGVVEIYGDDLLLYSGSLSQDSFDPVNFSVDVTNVRELKILLRGGWRSDSVDDDYFMPKICLADLEVTPTT